MVNSFTSNSIQTLREMEDAFHKALLVPMTGLPRMRKLQGESVEQYLIRFKRVREKFLKLSLEGDLLRRLGIISTLNFEEV